MERREIIKFLLEGYVSYKKKVSLEKSKNIIQNCIKHTAKELGISEKEVKNVIFNIRYISIYSANIPTDSETLNLIDQNDLSEFSRPVGIHKYIDPETLLSYNDIGYEKTRALADTYSEFLDPSIEWFEQQKSYSNNLSYLEKEIVGFYTSLEGDKDINDYVRDGDAAQRADLTNADHHDFIAVAHYEKTHKNPTDGGFWEYVSQLLNKIIVNSPPVDRDFITYRGKREELFREDQDAGFLFRQKGFSSTTLDLDAAILYAGTKEIYPVDTFFSYIEKIIIPKGSRVLWINELSSFDRDPEILLPLNQRFKVLAKCDKNDFYFGGLWLKGEVCLTEYIPPK